VSFLLVSVVVTYGTPGLSRAQVPIQHSSTPAEARPSPAVEGEFRDISKVLSSQHEHPAEAPSAASTPFRIVTIRQGAVVHAGGRDFSPPTEECANAMIDALDAREMVAAPDQECADLMEEALELRIRTGK